MRDMISMISMDGYLLINEMSKIWWTRHSERMKAIAFKTEDFISTNLAGSLRDWIPFENHSKANDGDKFIQAE